MKTIKCMMDHLYWADGRILDALEESETKNKDLLLSKQITKRDLNHS